MSRSFPQPQSARPPLPTDAPDLTVEAEVAESFRSGDALFAFGADLAIVLWNAEAEHLTGIPAEEALGRPCWDVLRAVDERGAIVCHPGCSGARLAREGWPVPCRRFLIKTADGRKLVTASTVTVQVPGEDLVVLQLLRNGQPLGDEDAEPVRLTRRQRQVLSFLAEGLPAKVIARRLEIAEATVRNHIQALLNELGSHSQLQAVAEARRRGLL